MRKLAIAAPIVAMLAAPAAIAADPPAADPDLAPFRQAYTSGSGLSYVVVKDDKGERIYRYGDASRQAAQKDTRGFMLFTCNSPHVFVAKNPRSSRPASSRPASPSSPTSMPSTLPGARTRW